MKAERAYYEIKMRMEKTNCRSLHIKSRQLFFPEDRRTEEIVFNLITNVLKPQRVIKYLGIWLDESLAFITHIEKTFEKADKNQATLAKIMPNVGSQLAQREWC